MYMHMYYVTVLSLQEPLDALREHTHTHFLVYGLISSYANARMSKKYSEKDEKYFSTGPLHNLSTNQLASQLTNERG